MKWIFFLILAGVFVYVFYSGQLSSSVTVNQETEEARLTKGNDETDAQLESNILNTMQRIKKQ